MGIFFRFPFFLYLCGMKVRVYPLTQSVPNYYFEYHFEPNYGLEGEVAGYSYSTTQSGCDNTQLAKKWGYGTNGWYGSEIFKRDLRDGIVKIITEIKPKQELKKLSFV